MKKNFKIILSCMLIFVVAIIVIKLWESGAFIFRRTADVCSEYVDWDGKRYSNISGDYTEGRTIAKSRNDDWKINEVEEDHSHMFIVVRSFLDQYLMVADDYDVPTDGALTTVSWNGNYINDPLFLEAVSSIEAEKTDSFTYETEGIFQLTEAQHMGSLYFAYENCPVTTNYKGYMGKVNGEWVITTYILQDTRNADGSPKLYSVSCYRIPEEYWDILARYFS